MAVNINELQRTKDMVISKLAVAEQMERDIAIKKEELKNKVGTLEDNSIEFLKSNGIYMDNILNMDYDRLGEDAVYTSNMQAEASKIITEIMNLVKVLADE